MRRETATWDVDLPHAFRAGRRTDTCWCGRERTDDLHDEAPPGSTPERAAQVLRTQKGS